jgi:two-component system, NarL family, response regulator NreC
VADRTIRVFVVEDHLLVRQALVHVLCATDGLEVVGEAGNGQEAIERIPELDPDVALVDLLMPVMGGIEAARWLRENHPRTEIVIVTGHHNEAYQRQAFECGVRGYVLKDIAIEQLLEAVRHAARGDYYLSGPAGRDLVAEYVKPWVARQQPGGVMTQRERQLAILIADGYSSKEAAAVLNISVKTADTHRASLMKKLGARNVADVVKYCIRNELIEP